MYDPFCDELWTATVGQSARLNGKVIHVSPRRRLEEAIISIGLSKSREHLEATLPLLNNLAHRVRKIRIIGAGAGAGADGGNAGPGGGVGEPGNAGGTNAGGPGDTGGASGGASCRPSGS